jgi:hypothetical protein
MVSTNVNRENTQNICNLNILQMYYVKFSQQTIYFLH